MTEINLKNLTILLIDDEPFIRKLIMRVLDEIGVRQVHEAEDGIEALEKLLKISNIDLIICDLEMPRMGGLDFVRNLRSKMGAMHAITPVLILTGNPSETNIKGAVELGINGFVTKPVSRTLLEKRITAAMKSPRINPKILKK